jgi:hypothetical protein
MLDYFNFFLRVIPLDRLRLELLSLVAFLNRCPFPHACLDCLFEVYFLATSLLRPEDFLSAGAHGRLRDLPRDFIPIPGRHISRGHILDCPLIAIGSGDGRFLLHYRYFRQLGLNFGTVLSLLYLDDPLPGLDVTHDGIDLIMH